MSDTTARQACVRALNELRDGRSPRIEPAQHQIGAAQLVDIATEVRLQVGAWVRVAWSDGAVRFVVPSAE